MLFGPPELSDLEPVGNAIGAVSGYDVAESKYETNLIWIECAQHKLFKLSSIIV